MDMLPSPDCGEGKKEICINRTPMSYDVINCLSFLLYSFADYAWPCKDMFCVHYIWTCLSIVYKDSCEPWRLWTICLPHLTTLSWKGHMIPATLSNKGSQLLFIVVHLCRQPSDRSHLITHQMCKIVYITTIIFWGWVGYTISQLPRIQFYICEGSFMLEHAVACGKKVQFIARQCTVHRDIAYNPMTAELALSPIVL